MLNQEKKSVEICFDSISATVNVGDETRFWSFAHIKSLV